MRTLARVVVFVLCVAVLRLGTHEATGAAGRSADGLRVSPGGHYFTYNDQTVMLVGGSGTHCVMQNLKIDYRQWIDDLTARGVNAAHLWGLVAPRQKQDGSVIEGRYGYVYPGVTPWRRRAMGPNATDQLKQWDLTQFDEGTDPNAHYWPRLRDLVAYAKKKNMCVGITLFFGWPKWDTARRPDWSYHPFNVVNGGHLTDNDAVQMIESPGTEVLGEKWSDSWPAAKKTQWVWEKYCEKMITDLGHCRNVFFVFMDEHSYSEGNCGNHFMDFFKRRGQVYVDWDARRGSVDAVYTGTRTSTNRNARAVREFNAMPTRPIMLLEGPPYELGSPGLRRSLWTFAIAGGHLFFHDDEGEGTLQTGIMGYDPNVKRGVKPLRTYDWLGLIARFFNTKVLDLDKMKPHNELIVEGKDAYCLADPGNDYAVYLRNGGSVTLKLPRTDGKTFAVEWLNPDTGEYYSEGRVVNGGTVTLTTPSFPEKDWVARVIGKK